MKIKKPIFWDKQEKTFIAYLLFPFILITKIINLIKKKKTNYKSSIKTICVGNIYLGGTGKTPLAIKINSLLKEKYKTVFIKKKYSNQTDEQKLLRKNGNLICKNNRIEALIEAEKDGYELAIFDDGLQDKSIFYDLSIVCFSTLLGVGNNLILPAGPLREDLSNLNYYDSVFINGYAKNDFLINKINSANSNISVFEGSYEIDNLSDVVTKKKYLVFSGLGNPKNFENTLKKYNIDFKKQYIFPDHYSYSDNEINKIKKEAKTLGLEIITTEKDFFRLSEEQSNNINYLKINLKINNEKMFLDYLESKI